MAILLTDTFDDSNGTNLAAHTADTGQTWTPHEDIAASVLTITSDRVYSSSGNNALYWASLEPATPDYEVVVVLDRLTNAAAASSIGAAGRISTTQLTYYLLRGSVLVDSTEVTWQLVKFVNTIQTVLATWVDTTPWNSLESRELTLRMVGDQITGYIDGVERLAAVDASIATAGRAGLKGGPAYGSGVIGVQAASIVVQDPILDPPTNTTLPTITEDGTPSEGDTLTGTIGTWEGEPSGYAWAWLRDGDAIAGATGTGEAPEYTLTASDAGTSVTLRVTATNVAGSTAATSDPVEVLDGAVDDALVNLAVTGLTGTLGARLWNRATGLPMAARYTDGIVELGTTGVYRVRVPRPAPGAYALLIDNGSPTPGNVTAIPYVVAEPV